MCNAHTCRAKPQPHRRHVIALRAIQARLNRIAVEDGGYDNSIRTAARCVGVAAERLSRKWAIAPLLALALSGCASTNVRHQARMQAYEAYLQQGRSYHAVSLQGSNMTISITGADRLTLDAPHQPLAPMQAQPGAWQAIGDAAKTIAPWAALGAGLYYNQPRAPTVVQQPPPVIVQPAFAP